VIAMNDTMKAINTAMESEKVHGDYRDNAICFYNNFDKAAVNFSQGRYITRIKKLAKEHPEECKIELENPDGSIIAQIPTKWIHIYPSKGRELSEEEKEASRERMKKLHEAKRISAT